MDDAQIKEELSISYLSAICARAGITYETRKHDEDSTDAIINKIIDLDNEQKYNSCLRIQLKCTSSETQFSEDDSIDNPEQRTEKAKEKLNIMNKYWKPYACIELELKTKKQHQTNYIKNIENQQIYNKQLNELKEQMLKLNSMSNAQERGYQLEHFLNMLFYFFDLNPSKSYKIKGEQIDGAFSFDGTDYLIEAKWQKELINATGLLAFAGKIAGKLKNTLGLYVSFNGFSKETLQIQNPLLHSIILMDGYDLTMIVEGRIKLTDMLSQKHFHASKTGENLYRCIC